MIRRPPRSTLFPTRRSSDLVHGGPFHSECPEGWFFHSPGLKLVAPSTPYDAKGLLRSEEHTSELQSLAYLVCRLLLEKKKMTQRSATTGRTTKMHRPFAMTL